jgi:hypothetical protein
MGAALQRVDLTGEIIVRHARFETAWIGRFPSANRRLTPDTELL